MSEWQPIETAPKDGTMVLGYDRHAQAPVVVEYRSEWVLSVNVWPNEDDAADPSHWMPLPKPPAE